MKAAGSDPNVRVVVLSAEGKVFSAGHDLREVAPPGPEGDWEHYSPEKVFMACSDLMLAIRKLPIPVIASVSGMRRR